MEVKLVKVYQILGIDLVGIKHHKDPGVPGVIHTAVIQVHIAPVFGRGSHVLGISVYVISNEHSGKKHRLLGFKQTPLWKAHAMNLKCIPVLYVIFAETTGVSSISSKIGSLLKKKKKSRLLGRI